MSSNLRILLIVIGLCGLGFVYLQRTKAKDHADFMQACLQNPFRTVESCEQAYAQK